MTSLLPYIHSNKVPVPLKKLRERAIIPISRKPPIKRSNIQ